MPQQSLIAKTLTEQAVTPPRTKSFKCQAF
jgi:hypothetical protein